MRPHEYARRVRLIGIVERSSERIKLVSYIEFGGSLIKEKSNL